MNATCDDACKIACGCKCVFVDVFFGGANAEHHEAVPFAGPHVRELFCIQRDARVAVIEERHAERQEFLCMERNVVLDFKKQMEQVLVKRNESAHFDKRVNEFVN